MNAAKLLLALAAVALSAPALAAQTVQGRFVDPQGQPVPGGRAVLRDGRGREVATAMTGADGGFVLRAPQAGRYSVAVERIGYGLTQEPVFQLGAGQTVEKRIAANPQRIALQGVVARGKARCTPRPGSGPETATVWEEARKALRSARENESAEYQYGVRRFWRQLDPEGRTIVYDSIAPAEITTGNPFVSAPAERLAQTGFIETAGSELVFHAPDAAVLLSPEFQDGHCFWVQEGEGGLIGLAFEPVRQGEKSDVLGTLWLDRATAELRRVEYRYTRVPGMTEPSEAASGRMDLRRMNDGRWIVSRWSIRMPVIVAQPVAGTVRVEIDRATRDQSQLHFRLAAQLEQGGDVLSVTTATGRVELAGAGTVRGVVFDSTQLQPLAGARVVVGGGHTAVADSAGRYAVRDVPAGEYELAFSSPRLDSLHFVPAPLRVSVREGATVEQDLSVPPLAAVWASACADSGQAPGRGVLVGRVHGTAGEPEPGARVAVSWTQPGAPAASVALVTDAQGVYRLCSAPAGPALTVRVSAPRATLTVSDLRVAQGRALRQDVGLPASTVARAGSTQAGGAAAQPTLSGVVRGAAGQPLAGATVRFGEHPPVTTDGQGRFRTRALPPSEYVVSVTHPELGTRTTRVALAAGGGEVDLRPASGEGAMVATVQRVVQLATLQAQARNLALDIQGFYDRQRAGQGIFLDEARLQRNRAGRLTDVLRGIPGVRVVRFSPRDSMNAPQREMRGSREVEDQYRIASARGSTAIVNGQGPCWMDVYVDGVQVQNWNPNLSQNLDSFPLSHVQAVEVYRGPAETPAQYRQAWSACGVVLLWTKI